MQVKIIFIGDISGNSGREAVKQVLPDLIAKHRPDLVIANGENATNGHGISVEHAQDLQKVGVTFFTGGNHSFYNRSHIELLSKADPIAIRPANFPPGVPGLGYKILDTGMQRVAVINLQGRVFMQEHVDCPFRTLERILKEDLAAEHLDAIFIDYHAEATSEKKALFYFCERFDRVSAIVGTHTHVQTNDAQIGQTGIGFITDVGMTGAYRSIIGVEIEPVLKRMLLQTPQKFDRENSGGFQLNAVVLTIEDHICQNIQPINLIIKPN